jgi:hypothetical protein
MRVNLNRLDRVPTWRGGDGNRLSVKAYYNTDAIYPAKDAIRALDAYRELGIIQGGVKRDACIKVKESYKYIKDPILNKFSEG